MAVSRLCSIQDCGKRAKARGWCVAHYERWKRHGDPLAGRTPVGEPMRYFREVVLSYTGDECLLWPFSTGGKGYGQLNVDGEDVYVHRLVCEARHGPPPTPEHEAAHSCGKGHLSCCAQNHLRWASTKENIADQIIHDTVSRGARHSQSKLTEAQVREIRRLSGSAPVRDIAAQFGVAAASISRIVNGKQWGWLP